MARKKQQTQAVPKGFQLEHTLELGEGVLPTGMLWNPDGEHFVCLSEHELLFGSHASASFSHTQTFGQQLWSFACSPDQETLALGTRDNKILLVDYYSGGVLKELSVERPELVEAIAWSPDGSLLASLSDALRIWDSGTRSLQRSFKIRREKANSLTWSPDGGRIAWAADQVHVRDVRTGKVLHKLDRDDLQGATSVAWSPWGNELAIACVNPLRVFVWNPETDELWTLLEEERDSSIKVHFSPDARLLAAKSWDHLWLWCVEDFKLFASLETGFVAFDNVFAFHPTEPVLAVPAPSRHNVDAIQIWRFDDTEIPGEPFVSDIEPAETTDDEPVAPESLGEAAASPDVFLSYARKDHDTAKKIVEALEAQGLEVWWDIHDLRGGEGFRDAIEHALDAAACVVVLWSKNSVSSQWVIDEAETGKEASKLVPVVIDHCRPPLGLRGLHTRNLSGWKSSAENPEFSGFLSDIHHYVGSGNVGEDTEQGEAEGYSYIDDDLSTVDPASEPSDADEQLRLAWYFRDIAEDRAGYIKWLRQSAEQGQAEAQCELGMAYLDGDAGLRKNKKSARKWLQASAEQGVELARSLLNDI